MMRVPYSCINSSELADTSPIGLGIFTYNDSSLPQGRLPFNYTDTEEYRKFYLRAQFATGLILYPIICLFGLCGNGLSIAVLSLKKMRTPTNIYLTSLAIADSIKLVNDMLYFVSILTMRTNPPLGRTMYAYLYPYAHYFFHMSVFCSAWITVSVAVERYILVCHPTRAKALCSFTTAKVICCLVFVSTSLLTVPLSLRYRSIRIYNRCEESEILEVTVSQLWRDKTFSTTYTWLHNSLRTVVPILSVTVLNCFIVKSLRESRRRRRNVTSLHRITVMLVSVIVVFVVCVTPDAIISTIFGYGYYEANYLVRAIREVTDLLLLVNCATNFILYCIFNYVFRKNFMAIFCTLDPHRNRVLKRDVTAHVCMAPANVPMGAAKGRGSTKSLVKSNNPKDSAAATVVPESLHEQPPVQGDLGRPQVEEINGDITKESLNADVKEVVNDCTEERNTTTTSSDTVKKNQNDVTGIGCKETTGGGRPNEILVSVQLDTRSRDDNFHESSL